MTVDAAADANALAERDDTVAPRSFARLVGRFAIYALLIIWTFIALFPIYWTLSTSLKLGRDVTQGHLIPWVDFAPSWKGMAVARPFARHDFQHLERARGVPQKIHQQRHLLGRRLRLRDCHRLARRLRAQPFRLQVRPVAEQGHLLLLRVAAHPAAGRSRDAVSRSLQGTGAARHADRPHPRLHVDGAADRHLGDARPVRHHPDARWSRRRWSTAARSGARSSASSCPSRCPAWSRPSSCRSSCAGTSTSSLRS